MIGFNKNLFKTILLCICLMKNENEETFTKIFQYLKDRFKLNSLNKTMIYLKQK